MSSQAYIIEIGSDAVGIVVREAGESIFHFHSALSSFRSLDGKNSPPRKQRTRRRLPMARDGRALLQSLHTGGTMSTPISIARLLLRRDLARARPLPMQRPFFPPSCRRSTLQRNCNRSMDFPPSLKPRHPNTSGHLFFLVLMARDLPDAG